MSCFRKIDGEDGVSLMQLTSLLASLDQGVHAVILDRVRRDSKSVK